MKYILTIDQGTSSLKTALWTERGELVADAARDYPLHRPDPLRAEMDANAWWAAACDTIRAALASGRVDPRDVAGVGVDGIGWTLVPVGRDCAPLAPAMIWLDRRAETETAWLRELPAAGRLVDMVANPIDPAYVTPKLLWLRRNRPEIFEAAHQFLTASGFLVARLTGEFTCDYTQAYGYHFFDIRAERWDADAARLLGVFQITFTDLDLTSYPVPPGSILPLFAQLGLVNASYGAKPALAVWDSARAVPFGAR